MACLHGVSCLFTYVPRAILNWEATADRQLPLGSAVTCSDLAAARRSETLSSLGYTRSCHEPWGVVPFCLSFLRPVNNMSRDSSCAVTFALTHTWRGLQMVKALLRDNASFVQPRVFLLKVQIRLLKVQMCFVLNTKHTARRAFLKSLKVANYTELLCLICPWF